MGRNNRIKFLKLFLPKIKGFFSEKTGDL